MSVINLRSDAYVDVHCHRVRGDADLALCSYDVQDFLTLMPAEYPACYSLGLHPWFIPAQDCMHALEVLALNSANAGLLAIGECGLDSLAVTPLSRQIEIFKWQIELAEQRGKPLIIHCVRAHDKLLQLKKQLAPRQPWLLHGFTGKPLLASQLVSHGCYLSFGKALLRADSQAVKALRVMPLASLFLETDADEAIAIGAIYAAAAKILALPLSTLQRQIVANFTRVFSHD